MKLHQLMGVRTEARRVALAGGGGKTTSLYALARESRAAGRRTALLTTTHIGRPQGLDVALFETAVPADELEQAWRQGRIVAVGRVAADGRLTPPEPQLWQTLCQWAEAAYIEADGSKGLPLKYPETWEPALPAETDQVMVICGLSALDEPFDTYCHRAALARQKLGISQHLIDEELMALVLAAGYARYNPTLVINQADDDLLRQRGQRLARLAAERGIKNSSVISLHCFLGIN